MSSAKVSIVTFGTCGRSEVNKIHSRGPKTLPGGTPDLMGNRAETSSFTRMRD